MRKIVMPAAIWLVSCCVAPAQVGAPAVSGLSFPSTSGASAATNGSLLGVGNVGFPGTAHKPESHSPPNIGSPAINLPGYTDNLGYVHSYPRYEQHSNPGALAFPFVPSIYGPYAAHLPRFPLGLCLYFIPRQLSR